MLLTTIYPESKTEVSAETLAAALADEYAIELDDPHPRSRYAWLAENAFDEMEDSTRGREYLIAVNLPFFADRLEWGGSIRGAWWDWKDHSFDVGYGSVTVTNRGMDDGEMEHFWGVLERFAALDDAEEKP